VVVQGLLSKPLCRWGRCLWPSSWRRKTHKASDDGAQVRTDRSALEPGVSTPTEAASPIDGGHVTEKIGC
jgi:hypothetical protein